MEVDSDFHWCGDDAAPDLDITHATHQNGTGGLDIDLTGSEGINTFDAAGPFQNSPSDRQFWRRIIIIGTSTGRSWVLDLKRGQTSSWATTSTSTTTETLCIPTWTSIVTSSRVFPAVILISMPGVAKAPGSTSTLAPAEGGSTQAPQRINLGAFARCREGPWQCLRGADSHHTPPSRQRDRPRHVHPFRTHQTPRKHSRLPPRPRERPRARPRAASHRTRRHVSERLEEDHLHRHLKGSILGPLPDVGVD